MTPCTSHFIARESRLNYVKCKDEFLGVFISNIGLMKMYDLL